jgi:adenylate cyclase
LLAPLLFFGPWRLAEYRAYDFLSVIDPPRPPEAGAIIVAIDEPSFAEIGKQWPWPRELHARLIQNLRHAGASTIAFDVIFAEPSQPEQDARLVAAMGSDIVLAADLSKVESAQASQLIRVEPLPELLAAGAEAGLVTVSLDGDGVLRHIPRAPGSFAALLARIQSAGEASQSPLGALIQMFGPDRTYPTVSYYQALDPDEFLPPGYFAGKTAIVGVSLQSAPTVDAGGVDAFATSYTPLTGRLTPGAEMQATVLDNIRHRLFVAPAPLWAEVALILLGSAAGILAAVRGASFRTALYAAGLIFAAGVASWAALRFGRLWFPPLLPALAVIGSASTAAGLDFAFERRARRRIARAFEHYLAPEMVARLASDPAALALGGERRTLTILFCDVRGFTSIAEGMKDEPEKLTQLLTRLLDPLSEAVLDAGGTIDKYIGDCVMAFWNAPLEDPDHAVHAVGCALAMLEAVDRLNAELAVESGAGTPPPVLAIGIGVNTGECIVGNMGSRRRFDYTVVGDAVNLASRLEGLSKTYKVPLVIGADTARLIESHFVLRELDRVAVRGRTSAEPIYTVTGAGAGRAEAR